MFPSSKLKDAHALTILHRDATSLRTHSIHTLCTSRYEALSTCNFLEGCLCLRQIRRQHPEMNISSKESRFQYSPTNMKRIYGRKGKKNCLTSRVHTGYKEKKPTKTLLIFEPSCCREGWWILEPCLASPEVQSWDLASQGLPAGLWCGAPEEAAIVLGKTSCLS